MNLPPYHNFPRISGDKISLREVNHSDIKVLVEISFYDTVQAKTFQDAAEMQMKIDRDYQAGNSIHWCIIDNATNNILGTCGFYRGLDKGDGELGCILLSEHRGKGYMTSALSLVIEFGLHTIGLESISAVTDQHNAKAMQLLQRLNFIRVETTERNEVEYKLR